MSSPLVVQIRQHWALIGIANHRAPVKRSTTVVVLPDGETVLSAPHELHTPVENATVVEVCKSGMCFSDATLSRLLRAVIQSALDELGADTARPLMLVLPQPWCCLDIVQSAMELFFAMGFTAMYCPQPCVAATLRFGMPSAVVVDVDHFSSSAATVVDGQSMLRGRTTTTTGVADVNTDLLEALGAADETRLLYDDTLMASCSIAHSASAEQRGFALSLLADEVRQTCAYCPTTKTVARSFTTVQGRTITADGCHVECFEKLLAGDDGLVRAAFKAKRAIDCELQTIMPVIIVGDIAETEGFSQKFHSELRKLDATFHRVKQLATAPSSSVWEGASVLSTVGALDGLWITREELVENPGGVLSKKLFLSV